MICATPNTDGTLILAPSQSDVATCPYVLMSGSEALHAQSSAFNLTLEQGGLLSAAILGVWAAAWLFRMFMRTVSQTEVE
jgi:hypothetical protein